MLKKINHKKIIISLTLFFILGFLSISNTALSMPNNINIKLDPEFPSANQNITVSTEVYSTNVNKAKISWYVDGILKLEGIGKRNFTFRTKNFGEVTNLTLSIDSSETGQISKTFKIIPAELDLIWETDTFTPPFYKGKALNTHQAVVKILASPNFITNNGTKIKPEELVYTWSVDGKTSGDGSGYGKNSFSFIGPDLYRKNVISTEASTIDGTIKNKQYIIIKNYRPEIIFYENDPLLGILTNRNLDYFSISNNSSEELKIKAYPFHFSLYNPDDIQYKWFVNNDSASGYKNNIVLRRGEITKGSFSVSLKIKDLKKFLLFTENDFNLNFK